ncbi:hypothetical protein IA01_03595 [Flavobacterium psychrophilum]|uniref:Uncharacterized protein n=2 Tax=Flavobacterium psychrophilum TaxID=96345 RepID=A6GXJ4_FLAPJ|nr:hypothetical protein [Flavobacterium psychrophilum]AIG29608.1 hypothetical protein IA03_03580 [Flavobacterium psychrophilum]AIG31885.1 hypothetical protein IA01_03595 [Flavobacterium psychrophilum]AIG34039.1 hypothetical protein IA02_02985 [Flavobacterium psychrophilum]AIG36403.1 hypothetical protein IA04_03495 [Flavobacterium psychrophilum]AIG38668.1 hypothetical protein IA05_03580 [Flavobacterium psychrophilum]
MNFKLLVLAFFTSIISFSQEINFKDLSTSSRGEFTSYISQDNATYKVGDRVKIGFPSSNKTFAFITEGDGLLSPITNLTST